MGWCMYGRGWVGLVRSAARVAACIARCFKLLKPQHGHLPFLTPQAVAPFRAVHASKGFTRLTGWHLHTLVAAQDHQQQQQYQQRPKQPHGNGQAQAPAPAPAPPLFCTLRGKGKGKGERQQEAAAAALLAEADVTGFARATLWLQPAPAPAPNHQPQPPLPFVSRVSVVPVLDRPLPAPPLARLFVPRLTHLMWTFERAPAPATGTGTVGPQ